MTHWTDWASLGMFALGCFVLLSGAVGMIRFPDFYTRLHAAGKNDSLALSLFVAALLFQTWRYGALGQGAWIRLVLIVLFVLVTSPVATHALSRAAWIDNIRPWTREDGRA
jgi:multicomponent Na+:H+ antiporter subunit G